MTNAEAIAAVPGNDRPAFERSVFQALRSKGNLLTLSRCASSFKLNVVEARTRAWTARGDAVTDVDRGRALWKLLLESIDRLRPVDAEPELTPAWRLYTVVHGIYVQGKSAKEMEAELGVSSRTLQRERRAAVQALFTVVWQIEEQSREKENE